MEIKEGEKDARGVREKVREKEVEVIAISKEIIRKAPTINIEE